MSSTVDLSFRYIEADYVRAFRAHHASHLRWRLDFVVVVALAGIGIYLWRSPQWHWFSVVCVVVASLFCLVLIAVFTVIPMFIFRNEPKFRDEYILEFSPEGIHFRTAHIVSQLQWSMYSKALVDAHSYILYYGSRQFSVIPTRVFQNSEQRQAFEQLLTQHVAEIVWRTK